MTCFTCQTSTRDTFIKTLLFTISLKYILMLKKNTFDVTIFGVPICAEEKACYNFIYTLCNDLIFIFLPHNFKDLYATPPYTGISL